MNEIQHLAKPKDGPAPKWFHVAVAASMIISAVSALIATLHTGKTMTALVEQNARLVRASSTPILEFGHGNTRDDGKANLDFVVRNVGSGMARVVWFEFKLDGKPMPNVRAVVQALNPEAKENVSLLSGPVANRFLAPGAEQRILGWARPSETETGVLKAWSELDKARFTRIEVEACFCSVFQECWTSKLGGDVPIPSPDCASEKRLSIRG
jgi:hypothetical protein